MNAHRAGDDLIPYYICSRVLQSAMVWLYTVALSSLPVVLLHREIRDVLCL